MTLNLAVIRSNKNECICWTERYEQEPNGLRPNFHKKFVVFSVNFAIIASL